MKKLTNCQASKRTRALKRLTFTPVNITHYVAHYEFDPLIGKQTKRVALYLSIRGKVQYSLVNHQRTHAQPSKLTSKFASHVRTITYCAAKSELSRDKITGSNHKFL